MNYISVEEIKEMSYEICENLGLDKSDINNRSRETDVVNTRKILAYALRKALNIQIYKLTALFSYTNHTSVINLLRKSEEHMQTEEEFRFNVNRAINYLMGYKIDNNQYFANTAFPEVRLSIGQILKDAVRRQATYQVQFSDYDLDAWTASCQLTEDRVEKLLDDCSVRKIRLELEM